MSKGLLKYASIKIQNIIAVQRFDVFNVNYIIFICHIIVTLYLIMMLETLYCNNVCIFNYMLLALFY